MSEDLFRDSTMTFGEHIEELRSHLIRAIAGIVVALFVSLLFGQWVVKIIIDPVEQEIKTWKQERAQRRIKEFREKEEALATSERAYVLLDAELEGEELQKLGKHLGTPVEEDPGPLTLRLRTSVASVLEEISDPLAEVQGGYSLKTLSAQEAFLTYFKASLGAAIVLAAPWVFYQIYSFIAVGLYAHERRFVHMSLPFSVVLFLSGVMVCYFLIFPFMLKFFLSANTWMDLEPDIRLTEWVGFSVMITIIFGVMFQLPLLMLVLGQVGIVTPDDLAAKRKYAILTIFLVAAIATPADPTTQIALAVPLCILFELGLFLMRYFERRNPFEVDDPSRDLDDEEPFF